jgi:hypothetical protein
VAAVKQFPALPAKLTDGPVVTGQREYDENTVKRRQQRGGAATKRTCVGVSRIRVWAVSSDLEGRCLQRPGAGARPPKLWCSRASPP